MLTDSFIRVTWLIFMCTARRHRLDYDRQLTRDLDICTWRDWLIYQSQVICHMTYVTWLNYMYDMTHFYVEHLAAIVFAMKGSSLVASKDVCNMTHSYDSFICIFDVTRFKTWWYSFMCVKPGRNRLDNDGQLTCDFETVQQHAHACIRGRVACVTWLIHTFDMTPWNLWHDHSRVWQGRCHVCGVTHP